MERAFIESSFLNDFKIEIKEQIDELEITLLELEPGKNNTETAAKVFRSFHTIKGLSGFINQDHIKKIAHECENLFVLYHKGTLDIDRNMINTLFFSLDLIQKIVILIPEKITEEIENLLESLFQALKVIKEKKEISDSDLSKNSGKPFGQLLIEKGLISESELENLLEKQKKEFQGLKIGQIAVKEKMLKPEQILEILKIQKNPERERKYQPINTSDYNISVTEGEKFLDSIANVLKTQKEIENEFIVKSTYDLELLNKLFQQGKILEEIQTDFLSRDSASTDYLFLKLKKLVMNVCGETFKKADLHFTGDEIKIEKNISLKVFNILMHLVKNSICHGIEKPEERKKAGKKEEGQIFIRTFLKEGELIFEVEDDGRGINRRKIIKAVDEMNLLIPGESLEEKSLLEILSIPYFSTSAEVDSNRGRGIGLSCISKDLESIDGKLELYTSENEGTKFRIRIPEESRLIWGIAVENGIDKFIFPSQSLFRVIPFVMERFLSENLKFRYFYDGKIYEVPFCGKMDKNLAKFTYVFLINSESKTIAIPVEKLLGSFLYNPNNSKTKKSKGLIFLDEVKIEAEEESKSLNLQFFCD